MIEKEIAELRRRFKPEHNNITHIRGCYVNDRKEIVSEFDQPIVTLSQMESEEIISVLRKTLSGKVNRNLIEISFATHQVVNSEEHKLLMTLRDSRLKDDEAVKTFFNATAESLQIEGSYMILLAYDTYDVPYQSGNDEGMDDASSTMFSYVLCSICPVKLSKTALSFAAGENRFYSCSTDHMVTAPQIGFLFPAFDDRATNIYSALYYTKDVKQNQAEFVDRIFKQELPMPAAAQKESFEGVLSEALQEDCSLEVIQAVQEKLCNLIEVHKETKEPENLVISRATVAGVLEENGVSESRIEAFKERYNEQFGYDAPISPANVVDTKQLQVTTPDVTIKVNPARGDLVQTRIIDGTKYILIRADEGVEVNGVNINIR